SSTSSSSPHLLHFMVSVTRNPNYSHINLHIAAKFYISDNKMKSIALEIAIKIKILTSSSIEFTRSASFLSMVSFDVN
ncbi:MAG: hypothetical protein ACRD8Z_18175, partial [Nitrososphaeraceae archaeon]